ncbi:MAG TPA: ABC transporter permease [Oligoflexia bacterium]|nr:ABC transporter permease [Oligoflexia bacterium]HMP49851.1 ABC transporter permease [Oligoflexia bacterium]
MKLLNSAINFIFTITSQRSLISSLAKREVRAQYRGSVLGFLWTIINPLIMIGVFWFVFSVGFKARPMGDVPFVVWLTAGLSVWMFFSEIVLGSTEIIIQNSQLIKKTLFRSQILPLVKILSSLLTHAIFIVILSGLILFEGLPLSWYFLQITYYLFAASVLALGLSWLTSSLTVFIRDIGKITAVLMQIGFWSTPIFWDISIMESPKIQAALRMNPMFYIVQGYRDSFIYFVPFWERSEETINFWCFAIILLVVGGMVFHRLKPHFADVL